MSYDLFFRWKSPNRSFSFEHVVTYFASRSHYEANDAQAWYSNEDSGVYFGFEFETSDDADADSEKDPSLLPVAFNLNFFRPHPVGLEAAIEFSAFVQEFDLAVSDPQPQGMGDGDYSDDGFLRGWNAGNAFAYSALLRQDWEQPFLTLPASLIEAAWRWNYSCEQRQNEVGEDAFVPRIIFLNLAGEIRTGAVWADGIPVLLPVVDIVIVPRQRLAARRWFRSKDDVVIFEWRELEPIARRFRRTNGQLESFEFFYEHTPEEVERIIREKPPAQVPEQVAFDQVLDRELLEKARGQSSLG